MNKDNTLLKNKQLSSKAAQLPLYTNKFINAASAIARAQWFRGGSGFLASYYVSVIHNSNVIIIGMINTRLNLIAIKIVVTQNIK